MLDMYPAGVSLATRSKRRGLAGDGGALTAQASHL